VALTKIDLVSSGLDAVRESVVQHLEGTPLEQAPVIPTSVVTGAGIENLKQALAKALAEAPLPRDYGKPRLPIDRAFSLRGVGTVVTGTLLGGTLRRGQEVLVQPGGTRTRIRAIQSYGREADLVGPGTRAALNLADLGVADQSGRAESNDTVARGQVITLQEVGQVSATWDVLLEKCARAADRKAALARPLRNGTRVYLHHGSGKFAAKVCFAGRQELGPGEAIPAQVRFEGRAFGLMGDRFIVRDWSEQSTLAGGIILDPDAARRHSASPARQEVLRTRAAAIKDPAVAVETELKLHQVLRRQTLLRQSHFSQAEIEGALSGLRAKGKVVAAGDLIAEGSWWNEQRRKAMAAVDDYHKSHPDQSGLPLSQLRSGFDARQTETFEALVSDLLKSGFTQTGSAIKRASHQPALPASLQAAGGKLRMLLASKPLDPPSRKELAPDPASQQALRFLIQAGEAVELNADVVLGREAYAGAVASVQQHLREGRSATVSELRQAIGATRRIVVPLLEKLDREGITRRDGDVRFLRKA
jgi:selenocysteine-specific elongation factor